MSDPEKALNEIRDEYIAETPLVQLSEADKALARFLGYDPENLSSAELAMVRLEKAILNGRIQLTCIKGGG